MPKDDAFPTAVLPPSALTGRKTRKTLDSQKKELVWPDNLEEALLEALRFYQPRSATGRPLRRFTKRNCFIAEHIRVRTGKERTAKQVGSRLQQISASSKDPELLEMITRRYYGPSSSETNYGSPTNSSRLSSPVITPSLTSIIDEEGDDCDDASHLAIFDVTESPFDQIQLNVALSTTGISAHLGLDAEIMSHGCDLILTVDNPHLSPVSHGLSSARTLPDLPIASLSGRVPNVTLFSSLLDPTIACFCAFTVYYDNSIFIHTEKTSLTSFPLPSGSVKYTTPLLPGFWGKLILKSDIDRYTIVQDIAQESTMQKVDVVAERRWLSFTYGFESTATTSAFPPAFRADPSSFITPEQHIPISSPSLHPSFLQFQTDPPFLQHPNSLYPCQGICVGGVPETLDFYEQSSPHNTKTGHFVPFID
ncbi:unnamed protein product [Cyclocybe aegerita]|uniref:TEA domain-containing protein n=1 Tax=Cyclocybe aegerita TaxID=1973307 RepID=A0A8S0X359_CYCAE|nr:unnamed protein product [Cyclocybe aegerita]